MSGIFPKEIDEALTLLEMMDMGPKERKRYKASLSEMGLEAK